MFYVVGLGNPGDEYSLSRHNTGRMTVAAFAKRFNLGEFEYDKKSDSLLTKGEINKERVVCVLPETFMNKSGKTVSFFIKPKTADNLIIVYDDIDLPLGMLKISYNKGSGGHKGLESVVRAVKTKEFVRVRIGISPVTAKGLAKKPGINLSPKAGEQAVLDFILGKFKPAEIEIIKKTFKKASEAIVSIIGDGRERAMNMFN